MKIADIKKNKWIWYCSYSIILVIIFLYALFPSRELEDFFKQSIKSFNPDLVLDFKRLSPVFPPGIKFSEMCASKRGNPDICVFQSERVTLKPKLLYLLTGNKAGTFRMRVGDGTVTGLIRLLKDNRIAIKTKIENVQVDSTTGLPEPLNERLEGDLAGSVFYEGSTKDPLNGSGEMEFILSEGLIKLVQPVLGLADIEYSELRLTGLLKEGKLNITEATLKGNDIGGNTTGSITLKNNISESVLNLKGEIEIYPSLYRDSPAIRDTVNLLNKGRNGSKLSFNISGTVARPKIGFN